MDLQKLRKTYVWKILVGVGILLLVVTLIDFQQRLVTMVTPQSHIYDKNFVPALTELGHLLPDDSLVVSSSYGPIVTYFTGHKEKTFLPQTVNDQETLVDYMMRKDIDYLLVFEGRATEKALLPLFSSTGLKKLDDNFELIASHSTDYSRIHLYKLKQDITTDGKKSTKGWQTYIANKMKISDRGIPDISAITSIAIRITDNDTGPVSAWLGKLSLVGENGKQAVITDFQGGHGFKKVGDSGTQSVDKQVFVLGTQSLRLDTDGNGSPLVTKLDMPSGIDLTGKDLRVQVKINDMSKLGEFRIIISSDDSNVRNYWIKVPKR